jgi:hypothetical protein
MARPPRPWIVTRHAPLARLDDNLWAVRGLVPGASFTRRMCIVRRSDGTLLFFHAIPLEEGALANVNALGRPALLVVGHDQHCIDARPFAERLGLRVYGPKERAARLRERVELAGTFEDLPPDPAVSVVSVPGSRLADAVAVVRSGGGSRVSLLFSDVVQNSPPNGLHWAFRVLGFSGGPKVVPAYRLLFMRDREALRSGLAEWARLPGLARLVPCHGNVVSEGAAAALAAAAAAL